MLVSRNGVYVVWYDQFCHRLIEDALEDMREERQLHGPDAHLDPPSESTLLAFYDRLNHEDRRALWFIGQLHRDRFLVPIDYWTVPPLEALPTKGQQ